MKKIFIGFALSLATFMFAQEYPNNGWGNEGIYNDGNYTDEDDQYFFPDDYYYNYPQDYYPQNYYQSYYNDYRQSIININWNNFFIQNRLSRWQIDQILYLNNLYANFSAWNNFYRYNPDRWYYDRFYAMERILGPRVFVVFQNNYYNGLSPIIYFQNYRRSYYTPRYRVSPRYRNVNINIYRVDRNNFRRVNNPTLNIIRNSGFRNGNNGTLRSNSGVRSGSNSGFRGSENSIRNNNNNNGVRGNSGNLRPQTPRNTTPRVENNAPRSNDNRGFRPQQRNESSSPRIQNNTPRQQNSNSESRNSGFRGNLVRS